MNSKRPAEPEVLPGADDELDCRPGSSLPSFIDSPDTLPELSALVALETFASGAEFDDHDEDPEDHHDVTWTTVGGLSAIDDVLASWRPNRAGWSVALERVALAVERPVNRLTSVQLNPLYHTGTIAFLLLGIVGLTGVYLFFFFQYGFDASYQAVTRMESQFIARTIRAIHRYASGALVIATLLHAYRSLFLEKFRGPRWLAWLTGMLMTAMVWLAGVTGYWLIWDVRAQVINDYFRHFLDNLTGLGPEYVALMTTAGVRGSSWAVLLAILAAHVILFILLVGFFVLHIRRLKRPKWLPPVHWVAAVAGVLLVLSAIFPVGMLPQTSLDRLPETFGIDPLFLFYLPFGQAWWFWLVLGILFLIFAALPWLVRLHRAAPTTMVPAYPASSVDQIDGASLSATTIPSVVLPPPVNIIKDRCTGCTKCALDCPYGAIEMVERHDGKPHKFIAIEDTSLCVSCGICVGSCDGVAVTLGTALPENLWQLVEKQPGLARPTLVRGKSDQSPNVPDGIAGATVIYTCDRHARHGARPYVTNGSLTTIGRVEPVVVVLPCVGTLPPDLAVRTLNAGAAEVRVVGCPPDDCTNREGNLWTEQRLTRERLPRLRKAFADAPIAAFWLAPDDFAKAIDAPIPLDETGQRDYAASRSLPRGLSWRNLVPAVLILGLVLLLQILFNDIAFTAYPDPQATVQMVIENGAAPFGLLSPDASADDRYNLQLLVDGELVSEQSIAADELLSATLEGSGPQLLEETIATGPHQVTIRFVGQETGSLIVLFDQSVDLGSGQVLRPVLNFGHISNCPAGVIDSQTVHCER